MGGLLLRRHSGDALARAGDCRPFEPAPQQQLAYPGREQDGFPIADIAASLAQFDW
jgi:hypothetical protein